MDPVDQTSQKLGFIGSVYRLPPSLTLNNLSVEDGKPVTKFVLAENSCTGRPFQSMDASRVVILIRPDGTVKLNDSLKLDDVKALPLGYLLALREIVNTAIYDIEHPRA